MAEQPDPALKNAQELEQEITCGICHEHYQEPKIFPCCHYYCKECIANLASRYKPNKPFPCPDCREPTTLPNNSPDKLPTAFFVNRMKALHSRMEKVDGKVEAICEMCSGGGKSVAFCRHCMQFICDSCVKAHSTIKAFAGHKISALEELKHGGVNALQAKEVPPPLCESHDEAKKLYCYDCKCLICRDCIIIEHGGHKYEFVKKAAPEIRKKLIEHLLPLKKLVPNMQHSVDSVVSTRVGAESNGKSIANQISQYFQKLHKILEDRKEDLLQELSKVMEEKTTSLIASEKNINLSMAAVQSLIEFVERTLANASNEEVVTMQAQVLSRIEAELEKQRQEVTSSDPLESLVVKLSIAEDLERLCSTKAVLLTNTCQVVAQYDNTKLPHKTKSQVDNHRDGVSTLESQVADKDHQLKTLQANNKASSAGGRPVPAVWQQELSIEQLMKEKATLENLVDNLRHKISTLETQVADKDHQLKTLRMGAYNKASSAGGRLIPAPRTRSVDSSLVKELETQLLATRMLYTTNIEDYKVLRVIHDSSEESMVLSVVCEKMSIPTPGRVYAMKVLSNYFQTQTQPEVRTQFQNEYQVLCQLPPHKNIIHMWAFFFDQVNFDIIPQFKTISKNYRRMSLFLLMDQHSMSMKEQVSTLVENRGPSPAAVTRWFKELLEALVFLEQNCVVHRDLKLDNLLLSADGNLIVSDFGKAVLLDQSFSIPYMHGTDVGGNRAHLSPEVLNAKPGPRKTLNYSKQPVWAAGVLAHELAGHPNPFDRGIIDQRGYSIDQVPSLKSTYCKHARFCQPLPRAFTTLVTSMLQPEARDRPSLSDCQFRMNSI